MIKRLPLLVLVIPLLASAQRTEELGFDRPEAWAMKYFGSVGLMQGNGPATGLGKGQWSLGFEIANIPRLDQAERTVGFNGTKEEDLNKAPLLARPLIHYGITNRLSVTASYVPPVEIFDGLKIHLVGASINFLAYKGKRWTANFRAIGQWTEAEGDFTVPARYVGDPTKDTFAAISASEDLYQSKTASIEITTTYKLPTKRLVYALFNATYSYGDFQFDVYVPQANDRAHTRKQLSDGYFWAFGTGLESPINERLDARLTLVYSPLDVRRPTDYDVENNSLVNLRLVFNYKL